MNGYDKYNHKTINKSKDGIVTYSYNHWEYVDDMLNHLLNDEKWWPQPTVLKDFNEMWQQKLVGREAFIHLILFKEKEPVISSNKMPFYPEKIYR